MGNPQNSKTIKPKGIRIQVTEKGILTTNIRIPFFVVKMGLKFGQMAYSSKTHERYEGELERLMDVDMDAILKALSNGDLSLPCLLVDVDESDKKQHVTITLE